jgi:aquaporin Z
MPRTRAPRARPGKRPHAGSHAPSDWPISRGSAPRDSDPVQTEPPPEPGLFARYEQGVRNRIADFNDPRQEWRRLFAEVLGTFFLVLVAGGGGMMSHAFPGMISRTAAVVAPGLMVTAVILFMGKVSGAHLNPAVSIAFALRRDFPWQRVPAYVVVELAGAILAALFLRAVIGVSAFYGSTYPAHGYTSPAAFWMELALTTGLVSVILGTASGAQNVGVIAAFGVGAYIALAGLWGSPISGASMNPARTFGPDLVATSFTAYWVYVAGPIAGATLAVAIAYILRGPGGGRSGSAAAQGDLLTDAPEPASPEPDRRSPRAPGAPTSTRSKVRTPGSAAGRWAVQIRGRQDSQ